MEENVMMQQKPIDLTKTTPVGNGTDGQVFQQGFIIRKASKFLTGAEIDQILTIPIFYNPDNGKILGDSVPEELRAEYKDDLI